MQKLKNGKWEEVEEKDLLDGDTYRKPVGGKMVDGVLVGNGWEQKVYLAPEPEIAEITLTVILSAYQCKLGDPIDYDITFSEDITVPFIVPISVSDRNGNHVTNIGCTVTNGKSVGTFIMPSTGDFTVTNEAINYHHTVIEAPLKLTSQPWLRVYQ